MMARHLENLVNKLNGMSLRERVLIFSAIAFMLIALTKSLFLDPLLAEQKKLSAKVQQQQEKMKALQAQIEASQLARKEEEHSPLRQRLTEVRQQVAEGELYLQGRRDRMVAPEEMAGLLEQMLSQNGRLHLINLKTLPVAPLMVGKRETAGAQDEQLFKHGVEITLRGSYLDVLDYLSEIEQLPAQMFWGRAEMKVGRPPEVVLTLTLYTLSLERTWLQI